MADQTKTALLKGAIQDAKHRQQQEKQAKDDRPGLTSAQRASTSGLNRPEANEFESFQQPSGSAVGGQIPTASSSPKQGVVQTVLFGPPDSSKIRKRYSTNPDIAFIGSSTDHQIDIKGTPSVDQMRQALFIVGQDLNLNARDPAFGRLLGLKPGEMSPEQARAIILAGAEDHLGLSKLQLAKEGLNADQIKIALKVLDPNASPDSKPPVEAIKAAGEPKATTPTTSTPATAPPLPVGGGDAVDDFIHLVEDILEPPEPRQPTALEEFQQLLRQNRIEQRFAQEPFFDNSNIIFRAMRQGMPNQGFGSQIWQTIRGFGGFGGAPMGGAASAAAPAAGATAAGGTTAAAAAPAAGAAAVGGGGALLPAIVIAVLLIVFILVINQLKLIDIAEYIPIQGTGDGTRYTSAISHRPMDGVCWPIESGTISETPEGHRGRPDFTAAEAIDIAVPEGTPIYAPFSGDITHSCMNLYGYGLMVEIQTAEGFKVILAHLSDIKEGVGIPGFCAGGKVNKGDLIGWTGNTGNSSGPHLHYELSQPSGNVQSIYNIIPPLDFPIGRECYQAGGE